MTIPIPAWVSTLGSLSPLIVGVAGILVGRKTKAATDDVRYSDLHTRITTLEEVQSKHVQTLAAVQQTLEFFEDRFIRIEQVGDATAGMVAEMRGMLYAMNGQVPPPIQIAPMLPRRR